MKVKCLKKSGSIQARGAMQGFRPSEYRTGRQSIDKGAGPAGDALLGVWFNFLQRQAQHPDFL